MSTHATCTLATGQTMSCTIESRHFASSGMVLFLFAIFCAYWAQSTNRSAWLWFFVGFFFAPITGIVLLYKNANDKKAASR